MTNEDRILEDMNIERAVMSDPRWQEDVLKNGAEINETHAAEEHPQDTK